MTRVLGQIEKAITFLYYRDLPRAEAFYRDVLGLDLAIDQGWAKIFHIHGVAHVGLVDEARGMNNWAEQKTVQLCIRVSDVMAAHEAVRGADPTEVWTNDALGIRAFTLRDPEGYQIEIQQAIRAGA